MSIFGIILCVYFGINSIICLIGLLDFIIRKGWKASRAYIIGFVIGTAVMFFAGGPFYAITISSDTCRERFKERAKEFEEDSNE